jgi:hypothetical protein
MAPSQLLPTGSVTRPIFQFDCTEQLLESECPKMAATSRFQNSTFSQVMKMLFIQTPKVGRFPVADDLACESKTWLCVI